MSAFDDLVATFLEELFALQPDVATAVGDHRHDDRWPDMSEAGHAARVAFIDRWEGTLAGLDAALDDRRRADRPGPGPGRARVVPVRRDGAARGDVEPAALGLPGRGRAAPAARPRLRAARRAARVRAGPARGDPAAAGPGARGHRHAPGAPGREAPRRGRRAAHRRCGAARAGCRRQRRGRRGDRPGRGRAPAPPARGRRRGRRGARGDGRAPRRRGRPERRAVPPSWASRCSRPSSATRSRTPTPRPRPSWPGRRPSTPPSGPRWSASPARSGRQWRPGEPVPDDEGALVRGTLDAIAADHPAADELVAFCREELGAGRGVLPRARA